MAVVASRTELTLTWTPPTSPDSVCDLIGNKRKHIDEAIEMEKANTRKVDDVHDEKSDSDATSITPLSTSEQLEYLTVNEYKWPSLNRKRQRMSEDERKARHREVQRQFMQRKLAKLDEMRHLVVVLEKQYLLLQLSQERARLEHENDYLSRQAAATPPHWSLPESQPRAPAPAQTQTSAALPWDEILEAVSEANV
ncbi:hypothetical protein Poli38472_011434 [Pythium oligandrum]|uniref:BZIP domain-containing protein n=1 Tax=Pythium oligandrum TaxID=41045 RepID=A0A8K1CJ67_PYTOL|nr:hypothetical protein Poli38472_011434 [Pythium oligandrum]|eukprot:TMW64554.1 hypothetical protein Poli38472_011434 [Pythium oligandrum]